MKVKNLILGGVLALIVSGILAPLVAAPLADAIGGGGDIAFYALKRWLYHRRVMGFVNQDREVLLTNLQEFIEMNPSFRNAEILSVMRFFIEFMMPFYVLAIIITGVYILFASASPDNRANAKSIFKRLVFTMVLISVSPTIMDLLLFLTGSLTRALLGIADINMVTGSLDELIDQFGGMHWKVALLFTDYAFILLAPMLLLVWGLFAIFALRYIAVVMWGILLPLSIFLYSFHFTRDLGRNILEQTVSWSFLQVLNALIIVVINVVLATRTQDFMVLRLTWGVTMDLPLILGCFAIAAAPLFMITIFRNYLPP